MDNPVPHPVTGELVDGDSIEALERAYSETSDHLGGVYRARSILLERLADLRGPAELPPARYRTSKQELVHRCPRCTDRLPADFDLGSMSVPL